MKKIIFSIFLLLLVTGCGKEKYITCENHVTNIDSNYVLDSNIKIYYKNDKVKKILVNENYTSDDENTLKYLNEYKDLYYQNQNDLYGGYIYNIKNNDNNITLDIEIDLNKLDVKKMVIDGKLDKYYTKQNTLTLTGAKYYYSSKGAECK